jgi:hypothetical protein
MSEWQAINTAPRDGHWVGLDKDGFPEVWSGYQYYLALMSPGVDADLKRMANNLRYWFPLPPSPSKTED